MKRELFNQEQIPYICAPLTGKTKSEILTEVANIISKKPDMLEWRVDFFSDINQTDKVLATLKEIHSESNGTPLLFTIRSKSEGGQEIPLNEIEVVELLCAVCESEYVDLVDYEAANQLEHVKRVREFSKINGKKLVLSYHNFKHTPSKLEIIQCLTKMASLGADVGKIALMPQNHEDVLTLLEATKEADEALNIPLITISMGDIGVMTRVLGWLYGSVLTFAVGEKSSAPGQVSIETVRGMVEMIKKSKEPNKV